MTDDGILTLADLQQLYPRLAEPMPEQAIQHAETRQFKGYDATGIGYQWVVNRANEVLGIGHWRVIHSMETTPLANGSYEVVTRVTIQLGNWIEGQWVPLAEVEAYGEHTAKSLGNAKKGSLTNGIKKAFALFGIGRQAYEGTLDDDFLDEESHAPTHQVGRGRPGGSVGSRPAPAAPVPSAPPSASEALGAEDPAAMAQIDAFVQATEGRPVTPKSAAPAAPKAAPPAAKAAPASGEQAPIMQAQVRAIEAMMKQLAKKQVAFDVPQYIQEEFGANVLTELTQSQGAQVLARINQALRGGAA